MKVIVKEKDQHRKDILKHKQIDEWIGQRDGENKGRREQGLGFIKCFKFIEPFSSCDKRNSFCQNLHIYIIFEGFISIKEILSYFFIT